MLLFVGKILLTKKKKQKKTMTKKHYKKQYQIFFFILYFMNLIGHKFYMNFRFIFPVSVLLSHFIYKYNFCFVYIHFTYI